MPAGYSSARNENVLQLSDGRELGYIEYGNEAGTTLFYFHGHPGSRLEARFLIQQAEQIGIRLIGIDRSGMGLSSYQPHRRILDWPNDVVTLADHLAIDRFSVVGFSGGGPYALACAYKIPTRLLACGVVSSVGQVSPFLAFLAQWLPWLVLPLTRRFFRDKAHAQQSLARFTGRWATPDRKAFLQSGISEILAASLVEAFRQGTRGPAYDGTLLGNPWRDMKLEDITFPAIYPWHGELDSQIPVATAREIANRLPRCKAIYYPHESHISTVVNHSVDIVTALTQQ